MRGKRIVASVMLAGTLLSCTSADNIGGFGNRKIGTAGGAAAGALLGQLIGKNTEGTLVGAGVGALLGLGWGAYRDKQEAELKARLRNSGAEVSRDGENLSINLPSGITFAVDSDRIDPDFYRTLDQIATVLIQYPETRILIMGHTDSTGNDAHNQKLSERRAESVRKYFVSQGVASNRTIAKGYGKNQPIASNATAEGRQANRRVEVKILPLQ